MIIEIRKTGFTNKGAELMLYAVIEQIKARYPDAMLTMPPTPSDGGAPFQEFTKLGFFPKAWLWRYGIQWGDFAQFMPRKLREMYGLVLDREVDVVLDAAGFSYSDQMGLHNIRELARSAHRWQKNGTTLIMLPQAFGPFKDTRSHPYVKRFLDAASLVFPRDAVSYQNLVKISAEQPKVQIRRDFTNITSGIIPEDFDRENNKVALIPNFRMLEKTSQEERNEFIPFMAKCAEWLKKGNKHPFLLIHGGAKDAELAKKISEAAGGINIVEEKHPLRIKGIIGTCDATIGSRFHGLVSALSQGVPSLATGWSHKYEKLFEDYEFSEGIVSPTDPDHVIQEKLDLITTPDSSHQIAQTLHSCSEKLKAETRAMWEQIFSVIEQKTEKA